MFAAIEGAIRAMERPMASQIVRLPRRRPVPSRGASVACAMLPPARGTAPLKHPVSSLPMPPRARRRPLPLRLLAGSDRASFVGEDDELHPVAAAELQQQARDVR